MLKSIEKKKKKYSWRLFSDEFETPNTASAIVLFLPPVFFFCNFFLSFSSLYPNIKIISFFN